MNCTDCRENLVAYVEGLLENETALQCKTHLETCPACQTEHVTIVGLQRRLMASASAAGLSLVGPVMNRIQRIQLEQERNSFMNKMLGGRWRFGLSAAAGMAALVLAFLFFASPRGQATAVEILARGAKAAARLASVHMRCQVRTLPADNFAMIAPEQDFVPVELWKQFDAGSKWRIDKPGRAAVMDGQSTILYIKPANLAMKVPPTAAAFDTGWLHAMADINKTISSELQAAQAQGWAMALSEEKAADGTAKTVVTVEAKSGLAANDYLKNKFFNTADTRRVYVFDPLTDKLEAVRVYLHTPAGEALIFEVSQIDYNQTIDPAVFHLELPANVTWYQEPQKLADNQKYAAMTPVQAARAFFEACGREDWNEAGKFWFAPLDDRIKQFLGGLEIVTLGEVFTSGATPAQFVPYEIKLKNGQVRKMNLALKKDQRTERWYIDGGI